MKIAIAQINTRVGDIEANFAKIADFAARAEKAGAELVVFPELALNGFPPMDLVEKKAFVDAGLAKLPAIAALSAKIAIACGYVDENLQGRPARNSVVVCDKGRIIARVQKSLLPTYDVFDEERYFAPSKPEDIAPVVVRGVPIGFSICEDIWDDKLHGHARYDFDPVELLVKRGARLLINLPASPYHLGKRPTKYEMFGAVASRHGLPLIAVNLVGGNTELVFDGGSAAFSASGEIVACAKCFGEDLIVFDTEAAAGPMRDWPESDEQNLEEALVLGLRDYIHKSGFRKTVIGISGGIDSAVTAAIAVRALGPENVLGVTMPSRFSSDESLAGAQALAKALNIELKDIPIEPMFAAALDALAPHFKGRATDATEENLQARIRSNILMAISNKFGHIVLATGNKSELAMGYCTLYGDMSGGLAVIGDVPKTMVYRLARHLNRDGEIVPERTIDRAPTAELRHDQTDQDSLPPYETLDAILDAYIIDYCECDEIVAMGYDAPTVARVLRTVDLNEYKRKQAAPCLKVTSKAFGSGRRTPIVQGWRASKARPE